MEFISLKELMLMLSISERKKKKKLILDVDAIEKKIKLISCASQRPFYSLDFITEWYFTTRTLQLQ